MVAQCGIEPHRVIFTDVAVKDYYMRRIHLADLFLDTPVYNGHTTMTDALWAGVQQLWLSREERALHTKAQEERGGRAHLHFQSYELRS